MRLEKLDPPIDLDHDHVLGPPDAELTLVEYGSYACRHCPAVQRQLIGAGALGGIGFTMSLFIAGLAFPNAADYAAAKIAIFVASLIAGVLGTIILYPRRREEDDAEAAIETSVPGALPLS